jgi:hypothetical protein
MPPHQALDPASAGGAALGAQCSVDTRTAIATTMQGMQAMDIGQQLSIRG